MVNNEKKYQYEIIKEFNKYNENEANHRRMERERQVNKILLISFRNKKPKTNTLIISIDLTTNSDSKSNWTLKRRKNLERIMKIILDFIIGKKNKKK